MSYDQRRQLCTVVFAAASSAALTPHGSGSPSPVIDLVRKAAAIRRLAPPDGTQPPWSPLDIACADERREAFGFTSQRLLFATRTTSNLRSLADGSSGGVPPVRVAATIDGFPTT